MVKQYQLRVHARDVNVNLSPVPGGTDIGNHTGYDLITKRGSPRLRRDVLLFWVPIPEPAVL